MEDYNTIGNGCEVYIIGLFKEVVPSIIVPGANIEELRSVLVRAFHNGSVIALETTFNLVRDGLKLNTEEGERYASRIVVGQLDGVRQAFAEQELAPIFHQVMAYGASHSVVLAVEEYVTREDKLTVLRVIGSWIQECEELLARKLDKIPNNSRGARVLH